MDIKKAFLDTWEIYKKNFLVICFGYSLIFFAPFLVFLSTPFLPGIILLVLFVLFFCVFLPFTFLISLISFLKPLETLIVKNLGWISSQNLVWISYLIILYILHPLASAIICVPLLVGIQMLFVKAKRGKKIVLFDILVPFNKISSISLISVGVGFLLLIPNSAGLEHYSTGMKHFLTFTPILSMLLATRGTFVLLAICDKNLSICAGALYGYQLIKKINARKHFWFIIDFLSIILVSLLIIMSVLLLINFPENIIFIYFCVISIILAPIPLGVYACAYADEG